MIQAFNPNEKYQLEFYNPFKKYHIVIFQKMFYNKAPQLAKRLKRNNTRIILDLNVNYLDKSFLADNEKYLHQALIKFLPLTDGIITPSPYIKDELINKFQKQNQLSRHQ